MLKINILLKRVNFYLRDWRVLFQRLASTN